MDIQFIFLAAFLLVVFYYDAFKQVIPNWLNVIGVLGGLVINLLVGSIDGLLFSFLGGLVCGLILLVLYIFKALGAGDVKLFIAIGCISGVLFGLYALMYSIIFAGVIGVLYLIFTRTIFKQITLSVIHMKESLQKKSLTPMDEFKKNVATKFPFIYAVLPGVAVTYYYMIILGGN